MRVKQGFFRERFCIDLSEETFFGYSDGATWNGFACPYFEYDEAVRVLEALGNEWQYDPASKTFTVKSLNEPFSDDPEVFEAQEIVVDGMALETYPIGAYSWIWDICE